MAATGPERHELATRIERSSVAAWPGLETVRDGGWLWLYAKGYTKRANSIRSMALTDDGDAEARLLRLATLSRQKDIVPTFRVTSLAGPGVLRALDTLAWAPFDDSLVLARPLVAPTVAPAGPTDVRLAVTPLTAPAFLDSQARLQGYSASTRETLAAMTARMAPGKGLVALDAQGDPVASLMVVVANKVAHINNVVTHPQHRRKGYARLLLAAGLQEAVGIGADVASLAVLADNKGALALYQQAGFAGVGSYHYRKEVQA